MLARVVLPRPGRPGQQDVVGRGAPPHRALQQQLELVAHPVLGDELGQPLRPDAGLRVPLRVAGVRRDEPSLGTVVRTGPTRLRSSGPAQQPDGLLEQHRHRRAPVTVDGLGDRGHRLVGLAGASSRARPAPGGPAPARPPPVTAGRAVGADRHRADPVAQLQDQPLGALLADARAPGSGSAVSPLAIALRTTSGVCTASTAWASRGPDPAGGLQQLEQLLLVVVGEAVQGERVLPDHQAGGQPGRLRRPAARRGCPARSAPPGPTPPTSITAPSGADRGHPSRARSRSSPLLRRSCAAAAAGLGQLRARVPPRQTWQMASASASAASAGRGGAASRSSRVTMAVDLRLVGLAGAGHRRLHLARRVRLHRQPGPRRRPARRPRWPARCPSRCGRCAG